MDDFWLFADDTRTLWAWKRAIIERLARLRLTIHESAAQAQPVTHGIPWLGFVVYPTHRRVKARKVRAATRHLRGRLDAYHEGRIGLTELDASVHGWIAHVASADTWGLRAQLFDAPLFRIR